MFGIFEIIFPLMFLMVFGVFIMTFVRIISQWNKNNHSPRLTVEAVIKDKRTNVSHRNNNGHHHRSTTYFVTFEVESGDRMELQVSGQEFGLLIQGDRGRLTFQGTRYLGFERM